jgi:hypothetical protein
MRRILLLAAAASGLATAAAPSASGQMHKVAKPEDVVRAVGVYEWTGDRAKPTASRLIPVTLFIDDELQDAGVYLARPVPFAIDSGTVYEIDKAGVPEGTLDVKYATHLQSADAAANYDDGWFGYGTFAPPPAPKKVAALKASTNLPKVESSRADIESDRPTLVRRHGSSSDDSTSASSDAKAGSSTSAAASPAPPDDPDRPHLTRRPDSSSASTQPAGSDTSASSSAPPAQSTSDTTADKTPASGSTGSTPSGDPDRPTLKKRTPEEAKKARQEAQASSATGLATSLNDDPNRPTLHHGKGQQALTEADLPKLKGLPVGIHQAVAVSDAKNRPVHDFSRPWADDAERATVLAKMQALARAQIAAYQAAAPTSPTKQTAARTPNSKLRHSTSKQSVAQPPLPLEDEQLNGYTLSYGGAPTYVYTAHTQGDGASLRYVTIVAQTDTFGNLQPAIQSVTDAAHLDRTPWMRLIDVVDADASNRASLLFELRGQTARQFALYRVIAARAEQTFLSGTTQ